MQTQLLLGEGLHPLNVPNPHVTVKQMFELNFLPNTVREEQLPVREVTGTFTDSCGALGGRHLLTVVLGCWLLLQVFPEPAGFLSDQFSAGDSHCFLSHKS